MNSINIKNILSSRKVKKYIKWFAVFLLIAFLAEFLAGFVYSFDEDKPRVESFLLSNDLVLKKVGDVKSLSLNNVLNFHGDSKKAPYKKYLYNVEGSTGAALVNVQVDKSCKNNDECFKITFN